MTNRSTTVASRTLIPVRPEQTKARRSLVAAAEE